MMSKYLIAILGIVLVLLAAFYVWRIASVKGPNFGSASSVNQAMSNTNSLSQATQEITINSNNMEITSSAFASNEAIPKKYTCDGESVSPPLEISGVPDSAKSLVLVLDDPDAPSGTFTHWTLWNIPPDTKEIAENSVPTGTVQGTTSAGKPGFVGPCPPYGTHRYVFHLYALDENLTLDSSAKPDQLQAAIEGRVVATAEDIGKYGR